MRRIIPLIVILVGWTFGLSPSLDVPANDRVTDIGNDEVLRTSIGVTPGVNAIQAIVHTEDFNYSTKKTRVLLVGWSDSESRAIRSALRWFYKSDEASSLREQFLLSVVPNAFPEAERRPARQFPASGKAYGDPKTMESQYLWRWIGMHAPDLVVDVQVGRSVGWFIPPGGELAKSGLASRLGPRAEGQANELAKALAKHPPCDTGTIEALRVTVAEAKPAFLPNLLSALRDAKIRGPSAARVEIQRRLDRSPVQVARQLGKHYGHELNRVVYIPALALMGRLWLGDLTNDPTHFEDVRRIVKPYFDGEKPTKPSSGSGLSGHLIFTELASRSQGAERARLLKLARNSADLAFGMQGKLNASMPFHNEMSDALFMGGPILAHVGKLTGDEKYFDACTRHLRFMRKLVLREDGLYRHSPLDEAAWGRGNGFPALGLALCLSHWPNERTDRAELLQMFRRHMAALAAHQDPNGCWHQVVDHPESYRELSSTCMITFAMARGIRNGWLDRETFLPAIIKAWYAIRTRVGSDGRLVDVCTGTGKQKNLRAYYDRQAILGRDPRGGAMALLASTEMADFLAASGDAD